MIADMPATNFNNDVVWGYDSIELCEYVMLKEYSLTLRVVNVDANTLGGSVVLTNCKTWEQERQHFSGKCLVSIKDEVMVWAKNKILSHHDCVVN